MSVSYREHHELVEWLKGKDYPEFLLEKIIKSNCEEWSLVNCGTKTLMKELGMNKIQVKALRKVLKDSNSNNNQVALRSDLLFDFGLLYQTGTFPKSNEKAFEYYLKSANLGYANAQCQVGIMYLDGQGVDKSTNEAVYWFEKAINQGDARAQFYLGCVYNLKQDFANAYEWFSKSANQGCSFSQNCLGLLYLKGRGVESSDEKAMEWFKKASDLGNADAMINLAELYLKMDEPSIAFPLLLQAAKSGHSYGEHQSGLFYLYGFGGESSEERAVECFENAANHGYQEADLYLATLYYCGIGVTRSRETALFFAEKAARNGYCYGKFIAAICSPFDRKKSSYWFHQLLEQSAECHPYIESIVRYHLGMFYLLGLGGVERSSQKAFEHWQKSAMLNFGPSQYNLFCCFLLGLGGPLSLTKSLYWFGRTLVTVVTSIISIFKEEDCYPHISPNNISKFTNK